jgi:hypothetical protein
MKLPSHGRGHEFESRRVHSCKAHTYAGNPSQREKSEFFSGPLYTNSTPTWRSPTVPQRMVFGTVVRRVSHSLSIGKRARLPKLVVFLGKVCVCSAEQCLLGISLFPSTLRGWRLSLPTCRRGPVQFLPTRGTGTYREAGLLFWYRSRTLPEQGTC